jgi:hypothetical protein
MRLYAPMLTNERPDLSMTYHGKVRPSVANGIHTLAKIEQVKIEERTLTPMVLRPCLASAQKGQIRSSRREGETEQW